jgi:hypothetical protein
MTDSRSRRFLVALFPAFLAPLQVLLFGPYTVYSANVQEFSAPFWTLARHLAPMLVAIGAALAAVGAILPRRLFPSYVVGLTAIGIVSWLQGNLLVGDYGVLDGQAIDWSGHAGRNRYELALWISVPIAAIVFARRLLATALFTSRVLVALQAVLLVVTAMQTEPETAARWQGPPDAIFELSSTRNVFHFVLDGFQSDIFPDILEADRAEMDRRFAGFTFFANHLGAFPTTMVSIPAMLTGSVYRNDEPVQPFLEKTFARASLFSVLRGRGYRVDAASGLIYDRAAASTYYRIPTPYVTYEVYTKFAAWQLADLALFRHSPHVFKRWIYNEQQWRLQTILGHSGDTAGRRYMPVNGQAFMADYTARARVAHDEPTYKYLHLGIPHWPVSVSATCEYIGARSLRRPNYTDQARCGLARVGAFLDKLRELGLYDSSLVLLTSDHGVAITPKGFTGDRAVFGAPLSDVAGAALPLFMIKAPGDAGPVRISNAPTAISDIPATIASALGVRHPFPGTSALSIDEHAARPREFALYAWRTALWHENYFPYLDIFTVDGQATQGTAWKLTRSLYAPAMKEAEPRTRGFHRPEPGTPGQVVRWSFPVAYLHQPPAARGFELQVQSTADRPQTITIEARGTVIDTKTLADHDWHTLSYSIPPSKSTPADGEWITLRVDPPWKVRGDRRTFGVLTRGLKWIEQSSRPVPPS